jgi:thiol-disulfide isomerase/thioredoxin
MKKHSLFFTGLSLLCFFATAQNRSIKFEHGTLAELKAKAKKENKLIFIDAYTVWCGPCKQMSRTIFTNDTVADFYNANFINAKIDMEKGEGLEIAKQYSVTCYPNLLFIDANGAIAHRQAGSMPVAMFIELGNTAKDVTRNFSSYVKNYEEKKTDASFLVNYIDAISGTCLEPNKELTQYFSLQKENDLLNETNWRMINEYTTDLNSREFKFLVDNKAKFSAQHTEKSVDEKIAAVAKTALYTIIKTKPFDQSAYDLTKEKITSLNISSAPEIIFESDLGLAKNNKDWKTFTALALANVGLYYLKNADELNSISWSFYEKVEDKMALLKAEEWARQATVLEPSYPNLDTYASLLYKNGKKEAALATANKAIEYAKKENYTADDYKPTSDLITKIKAMK